MIHIIWSSFDIETLDLAKVAKSFGFTVPPAVELSKFLNLIIEIIGNRKIYSKFESAKVFSKIYL